MEDLKTQLFQQILLARQRVYQLAPPTPLEILPLKRPGRFYLKREDRSPIHAYKWRGAFNKMAQMDRNQLQCGVVTASAGNHAQGVALSALKLGTQADIFMPQSTPEMKVREVRRLGEKAVTIHLVGDTFDEALQQALEEQARSGKQFIHAFNDLEVMGGQGTIADEVVMAGKGPFDYAFIQIGGGGLAAAVGCWLKAYYPDITIVGVEGEDQASMKAAVKADQPVRLDYLDVFCDGTAVREAGDLTFPLCRDYIDHFITVSNEEVSAAVQELWSAARCIPEPSGAMGLAGALKWEGSLEGKRVLLLLCGANMDFHQLGKMSREADLGAKRLRFFRIHIPEGPGKMLEVLKMFPTQTNIADFQYGKTHADRAYPVVGFEAEPEELEDLVRGFGTHQIVVEEVTHEEDVTFRVIPFKPGLSRNPWFIHLEFYERPGALSNFLSSLSHHASICYFNYSYSGERVGHALIGFEFDTAENRAAFLQATHALRGKSYRHLREVSEAVLERILSA